MLRTFLSCFQNNEEKVERTLSPFEEDQRRFRIEHEKLHEKHKGHEKMHAEMVLILIVTLVVAQILLVQWKRLFPKSYHAVTLFGMWIIPIVFAVKFWWLRFMSIWIIFSIITLMIFYFATMTKIHPRTPRLVYRWFLLIYQLSYSIGLIGYIIIMLTLFGFNVLILVKPQTAMDAGFLCLFYGLYYGVVGRDLAELCTDKMASQIGYYTETGLPSRKLESNICAVCGQEVRKFHDHHSQQDTPKDGNFIAFSFKTELKIFQSKFFYITLSIAEILDNSNLEKDKKLLKKLNFSSIPGPINFVIKNFFIR